MNDKQQYNEKRPKKLKIVPKCDSISKGGVRL